LTERRPVRVDPQFFVELDSQLGETRLFGIEIDQP